MAKVTVKNSAGSKSPPLREGYQLATTGKCASGANGKPKIPK